ncbi:hypothetical protein [Oceanobacillus sp. J11TS1]|uniref:hypothetical protein n=1 Tax=Oceanobacillus sp. J11TS1 TaxID=2807191 RepID=UPI001B1F5E38|nr:hypothetical protein [Oceanobacillus sp. J11TS1]GIO22488.1 hypothetical protein J11TS1_10690 [Oceanobacillus sp. J11TS1]
MILTGDTVRLICNFKRFDGQAIDPKNITLTIYDSNRKQIEQFSLDDSNRKDVGLYFYDYVVPDELEIIFEFKGIYSFFPVVVRDSFTTKFN